MFYGAKLFNGDISSWDVSSVTDMAFMFFEACAFDGNLSGWEVSKVKHMEDMFYHTAMENTNNLPTWYNQ